MKRLVWINGQFVTEDKAAISIYDSALMFGDMVFEMTRSFKHKHFKLEEHIQRLYQSALHFGIDIGMHPTVLIRVCEEVAARNPMPDNDEHRLLINVSRGYLPIYHQVAGYYDGPTVVVADFPLSWTLAGMGDYYWDGVDVVVPQQRQIPSGLLSARVKHRSRAHFMMAQREAGMMAGDRNFPVLLDPDGFVTEGPGYNIFFVDHNDALITPTDNHILEGITRNFVLNDLVDSSVDLFPEAEFTIHEAQLMKECFLTATPFGILPVRSFQGVQYKSHTMAQKLMKRWSEDFVEMDIVAQMKAFPKKVTNKLSLYGTGSDTR